MVRMPHDRYPECPCCKGPKKPQKPCTCNCSCQEKEGEIQKSEWLLLFCFFSIHMPPGPVSPALICSFLIFFFLKSDIIKITLITIITKWCYYIYQALLYCHMSMTGDQNVRREIFRERTLQRHEGFRRQLLQRQGWTPGEGTERRIHLWLQDRKYLEKREIRLICPKRSNWHNSFCFGS